MKGLVLAVAMMIMPFTVKAHQAKMKRLHATRTQRAFCIVMSLRLTLSTYDAFFKVPTEKGHGLLVLLPFKHVFIHHIMRGLASHKAEDTAHPVARNIVKTFICPAQGMRCGDDIIHF